MKMDKTQIYCDCALSSFRTFILIKIAIVVIKSLKVLYACLGICFFVSLAFSEDETQKKAQLALVVDFSKSGETAIQAITTNYWDLYNSFREEHPNVKLELALLGYSKQSFGSHNHYVKVISKFKDSPEKAFEFLVSNKDGSSVSENNVGHALNSALNALDWDSDESVKKQIITIGNGPIKDNYSLAQKVCAKAKKKHIVVNSLYVLYREKDKNHSYWLALTEMSGGRLKTIVPQYLIGGDTDYRTNQNDKKIINENEYLNSTYLGYGEMAETGLTRLNELDEKSSEIGYKTLSSRIQFKGSPYFQGINTDWDLVEKFHFENFTDFDKIILPRELKGLNNDQIEVALQMQWEERKTSLQIIHMLIQANKQINADFPEKPAYKRDIVETILNLFSEGGF